MRETFRTQAVEPRLFSLLVLKFISILCILAPVVSNAQTTPTFLEIQDLCRSKIEKDRPIIHNYITVQIMKNGYLFPQASIMAEQHMPGVIETGLNYCMNRFRYDMSAYSAIIEAQGDEREDAWMAFSGSCKLAPPPSGSCIKDEISAVRSLIALGQSDSPPGISILIETCDRALPADISWQGRRQCVNAVPRHLISKESVEKCQSFLPYRGNITGSEAGAALTQCVENRRTAK